MKCKKCNKNAISENGLCKEHFIKYFENNVKKTIKKYSLAKKGQKIIVAASGGKDSLTALYLMKKFYGDVTALLIDEGISNYREYSRADLEKFCKEHFIKLKIISFKKEFKKSLDEVIIENKDTNPCTFCGILRRYLINKYSLDYDLVVLGHNLDDEVQAVTMNFLRNNLDISSRLGPITGLKKSNKFTKRIKPLYFCTEKEVKIYSILMGFQDKFVECPYAKKSYRAFVRTFLNIHESTHPGIKKNIIKNFIKILPKIRKKYKKEGEIEYCKHCGFPAKNKICNACSTLKKYKIIE
jgi:uncharacterized protein (TIGR00269 family)